MADLAPNSDLLRSLARLVRGLSALFWGLPASLVVCVGTAMLGWFTVFGIIPPLIVTGMLVFGLWEIGAFQRQERPWRNVLDRTRVFALINFGLSPFLFWWNRAPAEPFFAIASLALAVGALSFLFSLNLVVLRLGAMLPDETLRLETRQFTALNRTLLTVFSVLALMYVLLSRAVQYYLVVPEQLNLSPLAWELRLPFGFELNGIWLVMAAICLLVLLPLALTMAMIWKTKEVILDSVFGMSR